MTDPTEWDCRIACGLLYGGDGSGHAPPYNEREKEVARAIAALREEERERCAKIADNYAVDHTTACPATHACEVADEIADRIRMVAEAEPHD